MQLTPITDRDAAKLIGVSYSTIRNAVSRGDLTRYPLPGLVQHVIKEQVLLFQGKKQLRVAALEKDARKTWEEIEAQITQNNTSSQETQPTQATPANMQGVTINMDANQFVKALINNGVVAPGGQLTFPSALTDKEDNQAGTLWGFAVFLIILLGLLWLFSNDETNQAALQAARTIEKLGLDKNDLATNQHEVITALKAHPEEAQKLKRILDNAGYKSPLAVA